jgi:muconolactone delta-isomerase
MKFLLIVTPRRDASIPPAAVAGMLAAQRDWLHDRMHDGTVEYAYSFAAGGGCGVLNVDSHEALNELIVNSPAFMISDYDARPLADLDSSIGNAVAALERAAGAVPQPG